MRLRTAPPTAVAGNCWPARSYRAACSAGRSSAVPQHAKPMRNRHGRAAATVALSVVLLVFSACITGGCARSRTPQVNLMASYAELDGTSGFRGGIGFDSAVARTDDNGSGARLGGRILLESFDRDGSEPVVTPQVLASYRHVFGDPRAGAPFVEPGLGVGFAIIDEEETGFIDWPDVDFVANPFIRAGLARERFTIGAEAGYQHFASGDIDGEWYLGLFLAFPVGR